MIIILGAGLAGLSCSYHIGHEKCLVLEKESGAFGHARHEIKNGFTWDEGPHISFTTNDHVKALFADSVNGEFNEYDIKIKNFFRGIWIDHPAQVSLYQIPDPLRRACVESFISAQAQRAGPANYKEWLDYYLGETFASTFSAAYTRKYWTVPPERLATSWIGKRVLRPDAEDVIRGSQGPLERSLHYFSKVRYPRTGGFQSFAEKIKKGCRIQYNAEVTGINLGEKEITLASGKKIKYDTLISTLPLPIFAGACQKVPPHVREALAALCCSELLLVNMEIPHDSPRDDGLIYVYDEDKLATRITLTEKFSRQNAPEGCSGIQTEVYFSRYKQMNMDIETIKSKVFDELCDMGLIDRNRLIAGGKPAAHTKYIPWANVMFTLETESALSIIYKWLEENGLKRESDDVHPLTRWDDKNPDSPGSLYMAGRYGQWKYYWSDDCILRGKYIAACLDPGGDK